VSSKCAEPRPKKTDARPQFAFLGRSAVGRRMPRGHGYKLTKAYCATNTDYCFFTQSYQCVEQFATGYCRFHIACFFPAHN